MAESAKDRQVVRAMKERNAELLRQAVHRQWRLGLTDTEIGRALNIGRRTVAAIREGLGLPPNKQGDR